MVEDSILQIFLTIYHGQLLATLFYDYVIRNSVRIFYFGAQWNIITDIVIGVLFGAFIIWAILSVWSKIRRNLIITAIVLIVMFIVRLSVGIAGLVNRHRAIDKRGYAEELAVFIVQMLVHLAGVVATWILANKQG